MYISNPSLSSQLVGYIQFCKKFFHICFFWSAYINFVLKYITFLLCSPLFRVYVTLSLACHAFLWSLLFWNFRWVPVFCAHSSLICWHSRSHLSNFYNLIVWLSRFFTVPWRVIWESGSCFCRSSLLQCCFLSLRAVQFQFLSQNHSTPHLLSMFPLLLTLHDFVMSKTNSTNNNNHHKNKSRHLGLTVCLQGNLLFALCHPGLCWDVYCEPHFFDRGS